QKGCHEAREASPAPRATSPGCCGSLSCPRRRAGPTRSQLRRLPLNEQQSNTMEHMSQSTDVGALTNTLENCSVWIRGQAQTIRAVGKNMVFVVVRKSWFTVQCVVTV
ncbi:Hypothetical predicted protein, partial [Prunus dulcis]